MTRLTGWVPSWASWIIWLLIVIIVIILVSLVVHALGGFSWNLHVGHFHLEVAVT